MDSIVKMRGYDLRDKLKKLEPFMADIENFKFACVYMVLADNHFTMVASNAVILCEIVSPVNTNGEFKGICPASVIRALIFLLTDITSEVSIQFYEGYFHFKIEKMELKIQGIDKMYPSYQDIIANSKPQKKIAFNAGYLREVLSALNDMPVDITCSDEIVTPHLFTSDKVEGVRCLIMPRLLGD